MRISLRNAVNCLAVLPALRGALLLFRETAWNSQLLLFFRSSTRRPSKISAGIKISPADNLLQEQQKQP
jgi:hypothetical protein